MTPSADECALLAAVYAAVDDPLPRLVYADWLDEHGFPEKAAVMRCDHWRAGEGLEGFDRQRWFEQHPHLYSRLVFMPGAGPRVVECVRYGVVFLLAWWSGPAQRVFHELSRTLTELDPSGELLFVVVDTDSVNQEWAELVERFRVPSGAGEAFWIDRGHPFIMTAVETRERYREVVEHLLRRKAHDESRVT